MREKRIFFNYLDYPICVKIFQPDRGDETLAEAWVALPTGQYPLKLDRGAGRYIKSPYWIKKLSAQDPGFRELKTTAIELVENRIRRHKEKLDRRNFIIIGGERTRYDDDELDFVDWQLEKIRKTGDVEHGAEVTLRTEQGQKMLAENPHSDSLKTEMKVLENSIIHKGLNDAEPG